MKTIQQCNLIEHIGEMIEFNGLKVKLIDCTVDGRKMTIETKEGIKKIYQYRKNNKLKVK
jgi:hypothetical protein